MKDVVIPERLAPGQGPHACTPYQFYPFGPDTRKYDKSYTWAVVHTDQFLKVPKLGWPTHIRDVSGGRNGISNAKRAIYFLKELHGTALAPELFDYWRCTGTPYFTILEDAVGVRLPQYVKAHNNEIPTWVLVAIESKSLVIGRRGIVHNSATADNWIVNDKTYSVVLADWGNAVDEADNDYSHLAVTDEHYMDLSKHPRLVPYATLFQAEKSLQQHIRQDGWTVQFQPGWSESAELPARIRSQLESLVVHAPIDPFANDLAPTLGQQLRQRQAMQPQPSPQRVPFAPGVWPRAAEATPAPSMDVSTPVTVMLPTIAPEDKSECTKTLWKVGPRFAKGSWGDVYEVTTSGAIKEPGTTGKFCVKIVDMMGPKAAYGRKAQQAMTNTDREVFFLIELRSHGIVPFLYDSWFCATNMSLYVVMERLPETVWDYVRTSNGVMPQWVWQKIRHVAITVGQMGILHGDAKLDNWLIDERKRRVVLTDWGYATDFREWRLDAPKMLGWLRTNIGCEFTDDPELVLYHTLFDIERSIRYKRVTVEGGMISPIPPGVYRRLRQLCNSDEYARRFDDSNDSESTQPPSSSD